MAVFVMRAGIDILPERRAEPRALEIVRGKGVACEKPMGVTPRDQARESAAGVVVEHNGGPRHPKDIAVVALVAQQLVEFIVITRKGGLSGVPLPESERLVVLFGRGETPCVNEYALFPVLGAAADHGVPFFEIAEFADLHAAVFKHRNAVHTALLRQQPAAADAEILGKDAHRVVIRGRGAVRRGRQDARVRRGHKARFVKIRRAVRFKYKRHDAASFHGGVADGK